MGEKRPADKGEASKVRMYSVEVKNKVQLLVPLLKASTGSFHHALEGKQSVSLAEAPFGLDNRANISVLRTSLRRDATNKP